MTETNMDALPRIIEYRGYEIRVNDRYYFEVSGPNWKEMIGHDSSTFHSIDAAKVGVDSFIAKRTKEEKARKRVKLVALNQRGQRVIITGLHAGNGYLLPKQEHGVYPDEPWIEALLLERVQIEARVDEIRNAIKPFYLSNHPIGIAGALKGDYDDHVGTLVRRFETLREGAIAAGKKRTEAQL